MEIKKIIFVNILNIICSILTCIIMKPHMFPRSLMHFPIGSIGSILLFKSAIHGISYIYMISLYQIIEFSAHMQINGVDYSWIDIEGYIIGFTYTTITYMYLIPSDIKKSNIELQYQP